MSRKHTDAVESCKMLFFADALGVVSQSVLPASVCVASFCLSKAEEAGDDSICRLKSTC